MPTVEIGTVILKPTPFAKMLQAISMYKKGKCFVVAAGLMVKERALFGENMPEPHEYVFLHLTCQGMECVLKGILLAFDFDKYHPHLKKRGDTGFGHDLQKLTRAAILVYGMNNLTEQAEAELANITSFYDKHRLRYGTFVDIFVTPFSIPRITVFRRLVATIRLADREFKKAGLLGSGPGNVTETG